MPPFKILAIAGIAVIADLDLKLKNIATEYSFIPFQMTLLARHTGHSFTQMFEFIFQNINVW